MTAAPNLWPALEGMCARVCGKAKGANPHPRRSVERAAWRAGWQEIGVSLSHVKQGPGRGRSKLGRRREWSLPELELLFRRAHSDTVPELVAQLAPLAPPGEPGRTEQAVRNQLHRMRKQGRLP